MMVSSEDEVFLARALMRAELSDRFAEMVLGHVWAVMDPERVGRDNYYVTHRSLAPTPLPEGWLPADRSLPVTRRLHLLDYTAHIGLAWPGVETLVLRGYAANLDRVAVGWRARLLAPGGHEVIRVDVEAAFALVKACIAAVEQEVVDGLA